MFKKLTVFLVFLLGISSVAITPSPVQAASSNTYYVSTTGDDSNSGRLTSLLNRFKKLQVFNGGGYCILARRYLQ